MAEPVVAEPAEPEPAVEAADSAAPAALAPDRRPRPRPPATPPAAAPPAAPSVGRPGRAQRWIGVALVLLGGFQVALGLRDLPNEGVPELMLGAGLFAVGATYFVPPDRPSLRRGVGIAGLLLAVAGLALTLLG